MHMNLKNFIFGGSVTGLSDRSGAYDGSIQGWLPIKDIVQGVVVTRDKRFVKILELLPVNFYTMSSLDKGAAIEDFAAYLKIAPICAAPRYSLLCGFTIQARRSTTVRRSCATCVMPES